MKKYLLPESGSFYKANLHCHSTFSDGKHTPAELKELYKSQGYSVLAITDHEGLIYHPELDDNEFITIPGVELAFYKIKNDPYITCHLCCYKKDNKNVYQPGYNAAFVHPSFAWTTNPEMRAQITPKGEAFCMLYTPENINHVIKTLKEEGFIITINHPTWSMQYESDYLAYEGLDNLEVYNNACYQGGFDEHDSKVYDTLLRKKGKRMFITASDDNHRRVDDPEKQDMFGGFTMFKAPSLNYENIMTAFESGNFYASSGPEIKELYVEDGYVVLTSDTPLRYVRMVTGEQRVGIVRNRDKSPVYEARIKIDTESVYLRLEAEDFDGGRAYTNAYFISDILQ